jgi:uncharacterized membrane protein YbhN (UPF0104 family)
MGNIRKIISIIVYCVAGYFFIKVLSNYWDQITLTIFRPHWHTLFISCILQLTIYFWSAYVAKYILDCLKEKVRFLDILKVITIPQFVNYIPGRVLSYASIIDLSVSAGISLQSMFIFVGINQIVTIILSLAFGSFALLFIPSFSSYFIYAPLIVILCLLLINPRILNAISNKVFTLLRKEPIAIKLETSHLAAVLFFNLIIYVLEGLSFSFFVISFLPFEKSLFLMCLFLFSFARIIGYLSVIAPAGFGVREGVIILGLKRLVTLEIATFLSIAYRFLGVLILGAVLLFCLPVKLRNDNKN